MVCIVGISNVGVGIAEFLQSINEPCKVFLQENSVYVNALEAKGINYMAADLDNLHLLFNGDTLEGVTAAIFPSEDEPFNLRAAMYAYELKRELKVVVRLFNLNMAKKLESSIPNFTVLSVSLLSAAAFAAFALLKSPVSAFMADSEATVIYNINAVEFGGMNVAEVEEIYDIRIISINDQMFPPPTLTLNSIDQLIVISSIEISIKLSGICRGAKEQATAAKEKRPFHFRNLFKGDTILTTTVAALVLILTGSSLYFHYHDGLSPINAIYFTITMITTVGFGDISLKDSSTVSKVIGMFVMLSGVTVTAVFFAILTGYILKKRIDLLMGHKRFNAKDHVVLCGIGDVGIRVLDHLISLGQQVVVIEKNPENKHIPLVQDSGIPLIISEAVSTQTLINANIEYAKSIVACTNEDMKNLEIALNARSLNSNIRAVLRIYDVGFARILERHFDIHYALSPAFLAAPVFAFKALGMDLDGVFSVKGQTYKVVKEGWEKLCIKKLA
ncbi:MAG: NAD-binding protein [Nitrospirae bacterium YQR-1]